MFANSRSAQALVMGVANPCKIDPLGSIAPLPNMAQFSQAKTGSDKVSIQSQPACTISDVIPLSQGDAAALPFGGGVLSGKTMEASERVTASKKLFIEGKPITRQTDSSTNNKKNSPATTMAPAQQIVTVAS